MSKPTLDVILRGYLYKENWTPLSTRRKSHRNYTIDFNKCIEDYEKLILSLKQKYEVATYVTSYDNTPDCIINTIKTKLSPRAIYLHAEQNSTQFTTLTNALSLLIKDINSISEHGLILRSDLLITNKFIELIRSTKYDSKSMYVMCQESNKFNRTVDMVHVIPKRLYKKFLHYTSLKGMKSGHYLHMSMPTKYLLPVNFKGHCTEQCKDSRNCAQYFSHSVS